MTQMLTLPAVAQIGTSREDLIALRVTGGIDAEQMDALARFLNSVFDERDTVDLLIVFDRYIPAAPADTFDWDAIKAWFRAGDSLRRYIVVGDGAHVNELLDGLSSILPLTPEIFDEELSAWRALDAHATAPGSV